MEIVMVLLRTVIFYVLIVLVYRFMGKREIGQLGVIDLIVSILIAEFAAISIENRDESIMFSIVPIICLVVFQVSLSYVSLKSSKTRNSVDGTPSIIIKEGKINFKEMVNQRYNLDDLLSQLREKEVRTIEDVDYAVLETNGKLSVFKKKNKKIGDYPLPLVLDGEIQNDTLQEIQKDEEWLYNTLNQEKVKLEDIFYAFYRKNDLFIIKMSDLE